MKNEMPFAAMNIPKHTKCMNCGKCFGVIPASQVEINTIRNYIAVNGIRPVEHDDKLTCPFRDDENKKCLIYPVRPLICRLMGVTKGMQCGNGNSAEIDGEKFLIDREFQKPILLNSVKW